MKFKFRSSGDIEEEVSKVNEVGRLLTHNLDDKDA